MISGTLIIMWLDYIMATTWCEKVLIVVSDSVTEANKRIISQTFITFLN